MDTIQPVNKYILSLMQTHPAHSLSHFINNAYMHGSNGDTVAFPVSSPNDKPSSSVSKCLISNCDQPQKFIRTHNCSQVLPLHYCKRKCHRNMKATSSLLHFSPLFHCHSKSLLHPLEKLKRVISLVSYTCVDVIIVNIKYHPYGAQTRLEKCVPSPPPHPPLQRIYLDSILHMGKT